ASSFPGRQSPARLTRHWRPTSGPSPMSWPPGSSRPAARRRMKTAPHGWSRRGVCGATLTAKLQRPQRSRKLTSEQIARLEEGLRELGINPGDMDPDDLLRQLEARVEFVVDPPDDAEAVLPAAKERKRRQNRESEDN